MKDFTYLIFLRNPYRECKSNIISEFYLIGQLKERYEINEEFEIHTFYTNWFETGQVKMKWIDSTMQKGIRLWQVNPLENYEYFCSANMIPGLYQLWNRI